MSNKILFIQGGGDNGYEADLSLVNELKAALGENYVITYPELNSDESAADFGWIRQIKQLVSESEEDVIIVAHSLGASMILKCISEEPINKKIAGIFLIATPFWSGNEEWKAGLKLKENFAEDLPAHVPLFFYHSKDDEEVPFDQLSTYRKKVKQAVFREVDTGGHQLKNNVDVVADDIRENSGSGK